VYCCVIGCGYGVNEKTSQIAYVNNTCLKKNAWDTILNIYSTNRITDSLFMDAVSDFKNVSFPVSLLYFDQEPKELIGVDYSSVRYVFNPLISNQILDGLSPELKEDEKKRIRNRVQKILMDYQCESGKNEAGRLKSK
jgi:hypothetical protein